VPRVDVRA
jgi:DnaJ family protein C protein 7